jgi:hypothetical protein
MFKQHFWVRRARKGSALYEHGFEVIPDLLDSAECEQLRSAFDHYLHEEIPDPSTGAYLVSRRNDMSKGGYDRQVFQLMNYQDLDPEFGSRASTLAKNLFKERAGLDLDVATVSIQVDWPDTETKRPYHLDGFSENYKLFIYLSDVESLQAGPYTVQPGSHRHIVKKWWNFLSAAVGRQLNLDDMNKLYRDEHATSVLAKEGNGIISCQALVHKGWQGHSGPKRYIVVVYMRPPGPKKQFTYGKELQISAPMSPEEAGAALAPKGD